MNTYILINLCTGRREKTVEAKSALSAKRKFGYEITPQGASGVMRGLISKGLAGSSKDENNQTRYWLNTCSWKDMTDAE